MTDKLQRLMTALTWHELKEVGGKTWFWVAIALLCIALEAAALFYQHALKILPCELCIYVRVWLIGLFLLALAALLLKRWPASRLASCVAGLALSLGLANETWNLIVVDYALGDGGACAFFANFPAWAPLDKWLPFMFEVQDFCKATPEILFGFTMTHGLTVVSVGLVAVFLIASWGSLKRLI